MHVGRGGATEQRQDEIKQGGELHGTSDTGRRVRPIPYMCLNNVMNGALTASVSGRDLRRTVPRPLSSRTTPATAFRLTMVERWICLNVQASRTLSSSLIGVRSSASPSAVTTVVYLLSARK